MLEAPIRSRRQRCLTIFLLGAAATFFCSCASEPKRTALINDPDAQKESSIPWNKPAKWESGANVPGGIGGGNIEN
ncbi:MAG: hypothetical protein ABI540_08680 [Spartobacteria bacterium]